MGANGKIGRRAIGVVDQKSPFHFLPDGCHVMVGSTEFGRTSFPLRVTGGMSRGCFRPSEELWIATFTATCDPQATGRSCSRRHVIHRVVDRAFVTSVVSTDSNPFQKGNWVSWEFKKGIANEIELRSRNRPFMYFLPADYKARILFPPQITVLSFAVGHWLVCLPRGCLSGSLHKNKRQPSPQRSRRPDSPFSCWPVDMRDPSWIASPFLTAHNVLPPGWRQFAVSMSISCFRKSLCR